MSTKFSRKWTKIFTRHDYLFVSISLWFIYIVNSCSSSPHILHVLFSFWVKDLPGYAEPRSSLSPPLMAYKWPQLFFLFPISVLWIWYRICRLRICWKKPDCHASRYQWLKDVVSGILFSIVFVSSLTFTSLVIK